MRNRTFIIALLLLLSLIYLSGGWFFSSQVIGSHTRPYNPEQAQGKLIRSNLPNDLEPEPVSVVSGEVMLAGSFYENSQDGQCAVLLLHGRGGNRSSMFRFAAPFWARGCDFLAYDSRGRKKTARIQSWPSFFDYMPVVRAYFYSHPTKHKPIQQNLASPCFAASDHSH